MNIKESIDFPRLHHQLLPMKVVYDRSSSSDILDYLTKAGHTVEPLPENERGSVAQGIAVSADGNIVTANNDWRKSGGVDGF